jgi:hypothetical protein
MQITDTSFRQIGRPRWRTKKVIKTWLRAPKWCQTPWRTGRLTIGRKKNLNLKEGMRKIGRGSQMGAWQQERLTDWPSVVIWHWLCTSHLIRTAMTYASPTWEFAAETHLLKLQRLQNRVLRTTGNLPSHTSVRDMHVAFQVRYVYDYITRLCRRQAEIIHNHENENVRNIGQGETPYRKYKRLKFGGAHVYDRSSVLDCHGNVNYY